MNRSFFLAFFPALRPAFWPAFWVRTGIFLAVVLWGPGAQAASITKGPWTQHVTATSAVIRIEVSPPSPVTVELGLMGPSAPEAGAGAASIIESREPQAVHSIQLKNLDPATRYSFTVRTQGAQRYGSLTTAPAESSGATFRFLVYGDTRTDDTAHAAVVRAMEVARSDFLVHTGDFVDKSGSAPEWQTFFDIEAPLTRERPIFGVVGNHELTDGAGLQFVRYFGPADIPAGNTLTLDQLSGTFRWSNARFFLVNGMVKFTSGATREWLDKALSDSDTEPGLVWRIVVVHHGPWSSGPHGDNPLLHEANIPALLKAHKVDLVISGHDHIYERGSADGLPYLVSGGGGSPVYRVKKAEPTSRRYESVRHYIEASVNAVGINFVAIRPDGSTIEQCELRKLGGWDCDGAKSDLEDASVRTAAAAPPAPPSKCGCKAAGADGATSSMGFVAFGSIAAAVALLFGRRLRRPVGSVR